LPGGGAAIVEYEAHRASASGLSGGVVADWSVDAAGAAFVKEVEIILRFMLPVISRYYPAQLAGLD
jgi:hypothetical protein